MNKKKNTWNFVLHKKNQMNYNVINVIYNKNKLNKLVDTQRFDLHI
jgi:hypothetical protein